MERTRPGVGAARVAAKAHSPVARGGGAQGMRRWWIASATGRPPPAAVSVALVAARGGRAARARGVMSAR